MDSEGKKFVWFDNYCETCKYRDYKEVDDPCFDCLMEPTNLYSHKPIKWKEGNVKGETNNGRKNGSTGSGDSEKRVIRSKKVL